jgi:hypothetical protein
MSFDPTMSLSSSAISGIQAAVSYLPSISTWQAGIGSSLTLVTQLFASVTSYLPSSSSISSIVPFQEREMSNYGIPNLNRRGQTNQENALKKYNSSHELAVMHVNKLAEVSFKPLMQLLTGKDESGKELIDGILEQIDQRDSVHDKLKMRERIEAQEDLSRLLKECLARASTLFLNEQQVIERRNHLSTADHFNQEAQADADDYEKHEAAAKQNSSPALPPTPPYQSFAINGLSHLSITDSLTTGISQFNRSIPSSTSLIRAATTFYSLTSTSFSKFTSTLTDPRGELKARTQTDALGEQLRLRRIEEGRFLEKYIRAQYLKYEKLKHFNLINDQLLQIMRSLVQKNLSEIKEKVVAILAVDPNERGLYQNQDGHSVKERALMRERKFKLITDTLEHIQIVFTSCQIDISRDSLKSINIKRGIQDLWKSYEKSRDELKVAHRDCQEASKEFMLLKDESVGKLMITSDSNGLETVETLSAYLERVIKENPTKAPTRSQLIANPPMHHSMERSTLSLQSSLTSPSSLSNSLDESELLGSLDGDEDPNLTCEMASLAAKALSPTRSLDNLFSENEFAPSVTLNASSSSPIRVDRDGNSFFEALLSSLEEERNLKSVLMNVIDLAANDEVSAELFTDGGSLRRAVVQWMRSHYESDQELRKRVTQSIEENRAQKTEALKIDLMSAYGSLGQDLTRSAHWQGEIKNLSQRLDGLKVSNHPEAYFKQMEREGSGASPAELYAASMKFQLPIKIFRRIDGKITEDPKAHLNLHFAKSPLALLDNGENSYDLLIS